MYLDNIDPGFEDFAIQPGGFAGAAILAQKVAPVDSEKFKWDTTIEEILGSSSHYRLP